MNNSKVVKIIINESLKSSIVTLLEKESNLLTARYNAISEVTKLSKQIKETFKYTLSLVMRDESVVYFNSRDTKLSTLDNLKNVYLSSPLSIINTISSEAKLKRFYKYHNELKKSNIENIESLLTLSLFDIWESENKKPKKEVKEKEEIIFDMSEETQKSIIESNEQITKEVNSKNFDIFRSSNIFKYLQKNTKDMSEIEISVLKENLQLYVNIL